jgi:hypothetical protein
LIFEKLFEPIESLVVELDRDPLSQAAKRLTFYPFVRMLLFRLWGQVRSLRDLVTELRTNPTVEPLGLEAVGLSTLHDAFARFPATWMARLSRHVVQTVELTEIPEVSALGRLVSADSSFWPVVRQLTWLRSQSLVEGVRLHLALTLNTLCPTAFLMTTDRSPTQTERRSLLALAEAGVTYILDRGYMDLRLYLGLIARQAFFVVRERNSIHFQVVESLAVTWSATLGVIDDLTDSIVTLDRDSKATRFRLVRFVAAGHVFHLVTNRFDLSTAQIVTLYAWRWQVELIFRAWKHTLGTLHWINLSESGIEIQFHILLIASVLWIRLHQSSASSLPASPAASRSGHRITPTSRLGVVFQVGWRLSRQLMLVLKNSLAQPWSRYVQSVIALRL